MNTPWGPSQSIERIDDNHLGILSVSTAGHGGIYVPDRLLNMIPVRHRNYARAWSGSENWYEEDCAWAAVALAFPQFFRQEELDAARATVAHYFPE